MKCQPEFSEGETVTFKPYEQEYKVTVKKVLPDYYGDGRVIYSVTADPVNSVIDGRRVIVGPAVSNAAGEYIMESRFFKPDS